MENHLLADVNYETCPTGSFQFNLNIPWRLAMLLIAWGQAPERTEAFVGRLPYGNFLLKELAKLDLMLSDRS